MCSQLVLAGFEPTIIQLSGGALPLDHPASVESQCASYAHLISAHEAHKKEKCWFRALI